MIRLLRRTPIARPPVRVTHWPSIADYLRARHPQLCEPRARDLPSPGHCPAAGHPHIAGGGDFLEAGDCAQRENFDVND